LFTFVITSVPLRLSSKLRVTLPTFGSGKEIEMIRIGDKVVSEEGDFGIVRAIRRSAKMVLVTWDFGFCSEHYLPAVKKVG
jgi:hypothetical protein